MTSQQAASLMASGVVGFLIATYIMHNGMNSRVSLDDARSLAQKNWTSSKLDGSIVQSIRPFNVSFSYFVSLAFPVVVQFKILSYWCF